MTYFTANNVPLCESEMTGYAEFVSGRDGDASVLTFADMHATYQSAGTGNSNTAGFIAFEPMQDGGSTLTHHAPHGKVNIHP